MTRYLAPYAILLLLLLVSPSAGCSLAGCINGGIEVRGDFIVIVAHHGKPLESVDVEIKPITSDSDGTRFSGSTDIDGKATIKNLAPGEYWLIASKLGIGAAYHCFHVSNRPSKTAKSTLKYAWGDDALATRGVAGKLVDLQSGTGGTPLWNLTHRVSIPISSASLLLRNGSTGEEFKTTSDGQGDFAFDAIPNGTYVLHIEGGTTGRSYDPTDLLIEVKGNAARSTVLLERQPPGATNCGDASLLASWK